MIYMLKLEEVQGSHIALGRNDCNLSLSLSLDNILAAMKKTELSASIPCPRCKVRIMKAVTKIQGIDEVAVDAEKGKVTVIGMADPVRIVEAVRKTVKVVRVDSIGDHKEEEPEPVKPPEEEPMKVAQPEPCKHMDPPAVAISFISYDDETPNCTIV